MSHLFSAASGKLSGLVASRNRGGPYVRAHAIPNDPNTFEQQACRAAMAALAERWTNELTNDQRQAWQRAAAAFTLPNRLGIPRHITGRAYFCRQNFVRHQMMEWLSLSPLTYDNPTPGPTCDVGPIPVMTVIDNATSSIRLAWSQEPWWQGDADAYLLVYASLQRPQTVNRYFGPWTLTYAVSAEDFNSPQEFSFNSGETLAAGHRLFTRLLFTAADGRLSQHIELSANAL
jgi:hypothetical protein